MFSKHLCREQLTQVLIVCAVAPEASAYSSIGLMKGTMSTGSFSTWTTNTPSSCVAVHPASLAKHPQNWTKDEVRAWLRWCSEEFCIDSVPPEKFDMNGKAICLLARSDFMERLPGNGDLLYNCLQTLISKSIGGGAIWEQRHPTASGIACSSVLYGDSRSSLPTDLLPTGLLLVSGANTASTHSSHSPTPGTHVPNKPYIPIQPRLVQSSLAVVKTVLSRSTPNLSPKVVERLSLEDVSMNGELKSPSLSPGIPVLKTEQPSHMNHEDNTDAVLSLRMHRSADCRLLWEFIHQLLLDTKYSKYVCWENKEDYVFRIANPTGLAELWGQQKNRTNMTYEKLSRALRYYYRMNIIRKVPGKRLTYKFLQPPSMIQKGQRGAKPHTKVHLPQTLPPVSNSEARIKYEDESDYDSVTSGLDSPERMESKSSSFDDNDSLQNEFERTNKTMTHHSSPYLASHPSMNFPIALPSFGQTSIFQETGLGLQNNAYQSWPVSPYFQHLDMPHDYDRLVDPKTNNIVRPMPSYPPISEIGPFQNCIKQDVNLVRAHSANSKDIGLIEKRDRVLRLPIDRFYRSQSCELPEKLNELMTSFPGTKDKQIACPRRDLQSEPEDLSMKKNAKVEPGFLEADYRQYQMDSRICNGVKSDDSDSCKNGDNS